ncbi:uncharacterized protein EMH_0091740 [Eimeria mitis]|uniref:Uncharacterized protein n=1 Tax=Eimeria mitis TaxID=44415 RepID=U6KK10_9EIME|nr:uncharacterized protein EMH_0091740 [Eimeria mitis]CDJ36607.1 hypothetical protein, conserved [Eimeria mitis]
MLHITRLRQALLSSAKEVGEVLSKALRADEASRVSQVVASFLDGPHASPAEEVPLTAAPADHSSSRVSVPTAHPAASSHVSEQRKGASFSNACDGPSFERAAFPSNSFSELCTTKTASREFDSRLNESEGWFLTDMISGCEDGSLHARMLRRGTNGSAASSVSSRSSRSRDHGSIVMVSSVESLLSEDKDDDVDSLSSGGSPKDEESSRSRHKLPISVSSVYPSAGEISGDVVETTTDLEQQAEQDNVPLLSELEKQCGDEAIYLINRKRICGGEKFYMIEAGHGWSGYQSLEVNTSERILRSLEESALTVVSSKYCMNLAGIFLIYLTVLALYLVLRNGWFSAHHIYILTAA